MKAFLFVSKIDLLRPRSSSLEPVAGTQTHLLVDTASCARLMPMATEPGSPWLIMPSLLDDWQEAVWPSKKGTDRSMSTPLKTWIRKLGPTLLITCHDRDNPGNHSLGAHSPEAEPQTVANYLAVRWNVEVLFEDNKRPPWADHYQLMERRCHPPFLDPDRLPGLFPG